MLKIRRFSALSVVVIIWLTGCKSSKREVPYGRSGTEDGKAVCFDDKDQAYSLGAAISADGQVLSCTPVGWKNETTK